MTCRDRAARLAGALLGAALASGCASLSVMSHMPLSTMSRLSSLKLAEIDPAELRVAARLPDALEPRSHGVKVRIEVAGMKQGKNSAMELILELTADPSELAPLSAQRRAGHGIWVYRLSRSDVDRLKALIAEAVGASGVSLAAGVEACHRKPYGSAALPTTTFLKTNVTGFFVLTQDLDLRSVVSEQHLAARVPPCA
jgi:hypothetical protein